MAEKRVTKKGFEIIDVEEREMKNIGSACICDHCDERIRRKGIYVAVLNHFVCKSCFDKWHNKATWYLEDAKIEKRNQDYYAMLLGAI